MNKFASFACRANDRDTYLALRPRLTGVIESGLWPRAEGLDVCDLRFGYQPVIAKANDPSAADATLPEAADADNSIKREASYYLEKKNVVGVDLCDDNGKLRKCDDHLRAVPSMQIQAMWQDRDFARLEATFAAWCSGRERFADGLWKWRIAGFHVLELEELER